MIYLLCDLLCCHLLYIPIEVIVLGCLQEVREAWLLLASQFLMNSFHISILYLVQLHL